MNECGEDDQLPRQITAGNDSSSSSRNNSGDGGKNVSEMNVEDFCVFIENNIKSRRERMNQSSESVGEDRMNVVENRLLSNDLASMKGIHNHIKRVQIEKKKRSDENDYRKEQFWV